MIYVTGPGSGFTVRRLTIEHKDPFVLSAGVFTGWLRAVCLMDNHVPFQKYVRLDETNLLRLYLAGRLHTVAESVVAFLFK